MKPLRQTFEQPLLGGDEEVALGVVLADQSRCVLLDLDQRAARLRECLQLGVERLG